MSNLNPDDEQKAAEDRINSIRHHGGAAPEQPAQPQPQQRARVETPSRARTTYEETGRVGATSGTGANRNRALMMVGSLVGVGILIVVVILLLSGVFFGGGGGPLAGFLASATPTATLTPTSTSTPTVTPTPTATPTAPPFTIPGLTCLFDGSVTCFDYCQQTANVAECDKAKQDIAAQGLDANAWFQCIAPGPGVEGNALDCARKVYYAKLMPVTAPAAATTAAPTP